MIAMRYIIYCRKSTDTEDKQVLSLDSQEHDMVALAKANGLEVKTILRESQSAKTLGRPVFRKMMHMIKSGQADGIICWKLDRLARNMIEGGEVMHALQEGVLKEIRTYESVHLPSDNVLMLAVHFGMANQYSRDLSANVKRGNRAKLERGEWPSRAPMGYLNDKNTRKVVIDPIGSKAILRCFELFLSGNYSMGQVFKTLNKEGYRTNTGGRFSKSKVDHTLKNPFYYGMMLREGKLYQGTHTPLITKAQFDRVHDIITGVARPRTKTLFFTFRGLLSCPCGCQYTASLKKGHEYYYCTNGKGQCMAHKRYLRSEAVQELVASTLADLHFDEELIEIMYEAARERYANSSDHDLATKLRLEKRLEALQGQELTAFDAYSSGLLRPELYTIKVNQITEEREVVKEQLSVLKTTDRIATLEPTKNLFLQASRAKKAFLTADPQKQRDIASEVLWNLSIKEGNVAQVKYKEPYRLLAKAPKNADSLTMWTLWDDVGTNLILLGFH